MKHRGQYIPAKPNANIIYPICDIVENASTRLISVWVQAMIAASKAEMAPTSKNDLQYPRISADKAQIAWPPGTHPPPPLLQHG